MARSRTRTRSRPRTTSGAPIPTSTARSRPPWTTSGASTSSAHTSVFPDSPTPYPMAPLTRPHCSPTCSLPPLLQGHSPLERLLVRPLSPLWHGHGRFYGKVTPTSDDLVHPLPLHLLRVCPLPVFPPPVCFPRMTPPC